MKDIKKGFLLKYMFLAAALILGVIYFETILSFGENLFNVLKPLILGLAIAYTLNLLMRKLEQFYFPKSNKKIVLLTRRAVCILLSILIVIGIVVGLILIVMPQLVRTMTVLFESVPKTINYAIEYIQLHMDDYPVIRQSVDSFGVNLEEWIKNIMTVGTNVVTGILNSSISAASNVTSQIVNAVIGIIFAIYVLANKEKLGQQLGYLMKAYLKKGTQEKIQYVVNVANDSFSSFITGQCLEAVILGTLCAIGMAIFQFPYAGMIGTFIGATALIPVVGAYIGAALGVIMIVTVSPIKALLFIVFILVLQQLENNLIYPKVVGSSIGLPGMWVLVAVTVGGGLGGVMGMILGVPMAATLYKLTKNDVAKRLKSVN